jgi:hypothetical protein
MCQAHCPENSLGTTRLVIEAQNLCQCQILPEGGGGGGGGN